MPSKQIKTSAVASSFARASKDKKAKADKQKSKVQSSKAKKVTKAPVKKPVGKALPKETPARKASVSVAGEGLKLSVYNTSGKAVETLTLPKEIFGANINTNLMTQAVRVYLANQRRGTVKTKSRGEVNISTRKIYRQKGTGRARHGAASAPIFVGGGLAFGPRQRDYSLKLSKKMKRLALISSLSAKVKEGQVKLVSGLGKIEPKTKIMAQMLEKLNLKEKNANLLLVTPPFAKASEGKPSSNFTNVVKAARNIEGVTVVSANILNTYEVLKNKNLLLMKECIDTFKERLKEN